MSLGSVDQSGANSGFSMLPGNSRLKRQGALPRLIQNGSTHGEQLVYEVSVSCLGSLAPETFHKERHGWALCVSDILKEPIIPVPENGDPGCSVQRPAPGGSRGPSSTDAV